ncbi:MAG: helix-turn-helix domain-containing protein [Acidobacteriales bacterium]|nr:helix-turn-helix domain-containing protein [Terriglobales bacterium]
MSIERGIEHANLPLVLLSDFEAATVLRLADDAATPEIAVKRLNRLVDSGQLRPCIVGKRRRYSLSELTRFINAQVERYAEVCE